MQQLTDLAHAYTDIAEDLSPRATRIRWAGLSGRERGDERADGPAFVFLHGLTFDRRMWDPVLGALPEGHRAIAFDLPAHGGSPALGRPGLAAVVDALHDAVVDAGLAAPIVVGHSIGGPLASIYAATYPASGVVSVDAPIRIEPFAELLRSMRPQLTEDGFDAVWARFRESWRMELVPVERRGLLRAGEQASLELVLGYQHDLLERPLEDVLRWREEGLGRLRRQRTPYVSLHANPVDPLDEASLRDLVPQAEVVVWPVGHHFPHLADPVGFVALLIELARTGAAGNSRA